MIVITILCTITSIILHKIAPRSPPYVIQPSIAADRDTTVSYGLSSAVNHLTINYEQTTYFTPKKLHRMSHACGEL
nr:hypothetical protein BgiMline_022583 [Biomphalaria glabrata]